MAPFASSEGVPSNCPEFTSTPGSRYACVSGSPSQSSGAITTGMGSPNSSANSKSRSSCAGTPMTAPVPYVAST